MLLCISGQARRTRLTGLGTLQRRFVRSFCSQVPEDKWPVAGGKRVDAKLKLVRQKYDETRFNEFKYEEEMRGIKVKKERPLNLDTMKQYTSDAAWYFLPRGYPSSLAKGYDKFAVSQLVSTVLGTTCGVLSMQSMLFAIGAGKFGWWILHYTSGVLCIRQLWSPSIVSFKASITAHDQYTDIYPQTCICILM
jgi:hypothetical protein